MSNPGERLLGVGARRAAALITRYRTLKVSLVLRRDLTKALAPFRARLPIEVRFGAEDEMDQLASLTPDHHPEVLRDRLRRGNKCFLAVIEGRIVAFNWLILTSADDAYYRVALRPADVYCMDAFTAEPYRGKAIHTELLFRILAHASELGRQRAYTRVSPTNTSSWKTHLRLGWSVAGASFAFVPHGARLGADRRFGPSVYPLRPLYEEAPY